MTFYQNDDDLIAFGVIAIIYTFIDKNRLKTVQVIDDLLVAETAMYYNVFEYIDNVYNK